MRRVEKTKIVCTIGPTSSSLRVLRELARAGMNVARLNFSHGTHAEHLAVMQRLKQVRAQTGKNIGILQDLGGPKIRVGELPAEGLRLPEGGEALLVEEDARGKGAAGQPGPRSVPVIPVQYPHLLQDIPASARILMDDGQLELRVEAKEEAHLRCRIVHGGLLKSHQGVNFPGLSLTERAPTRKDLEDLRFGIEQGVDFVALSFVQDAEDVLSLREEIRGRNASPLVIAKLEREAALKNLDSILEVSDGVMVARGDLGVEADLSMIPVYQKKIIHKAKQRGLITITATQMLDSMIHSPLPTRAEVTDVANAIYDGSDAVMLSAETAAGEYPVQSVQRMRQIASYVEENLAQTSGWLRGDERDAGDSEESVMARSVCNAAFRVGARYIVAHTISGRTARLISRYRPNTPMVAVTPLESTFYQLSLVWGLDALRVAEFESDFLQTIARGDRSLREAGYVKPGDLVVISAGIPSGKTGGTNVMKLHRVERD